MKRNEKKSDFLRDSSASSLFKSKLIFWLLLLQILLPPGAARLSATAGDLFNSLFYTEGIWPPQSYARTLNRPTCPENLEALMGQMLPELPGYANRVLRRSPPGNQTDPKIYVITAGNPEFEPLPLGPGRSATGRPTSQENSLPSRGDSGSSYSRHPTSNDDPQQVFITTLERQYRGNQVVQIPRYHWLFLTKTNQGWRLALMFSRMGSNRLNEPLTPPEESSDSFVAEAIRLWLRDLWLNNCSDRQNSQPDISYQSFFTKLNFSSAKPGGDCGNCLLFSAFWLR